LIFENFEMRGNELLSGLSPIDIIKIDDLRLRNSKMMGALPAVLRVVEVGFIEVKNIEVTNSWTSNPECKLKTKNY
jgi:hypothetical protein